MSTNWETVGKGKMTRSQKKTAADRMPKQDGEATPLQVADSMFKPFEEKTKNNHANKKPLQDRSNNQVSPKAAAKKSKKPKKHGTSSKYKFDSFNEAVQNVSLSALSEKASQCRTRFPKNPNIWLKDIAAYLNDMISCPDASPALTDKEFSYPMSKVPKSIWNLLHKWYVEDASDVVKELLFEHCLNSMLDCIVKDQPTWGYRICLQALAHGSPKNFCKNLDRELDRILNMKNVPKRCLAYMWALGQVGVKDPQCGMKVWLNVMLPMMNVKSLAPFIVQYLERLITSTKDPVGKLSGTVNADDFLLIMRWCFDNTSVLSPNLQERMRDVYRPIRLLATGSPKLRVLLFKRYLEASQEEISSVRTELLEVVFECMQSNPQCFSVWREKYMTALSQTRILLEYLESHWVEALYKLPRKQFQDTIQAFHNTNLDAATQSSHITSFHDFKAVNEICKEMHHKLAEESHRTLSKCNHIVVPILVALLAVGLGMFMYDVHIHGGVVEKSATYKTLEKSGTLDFLRQVWTKVSIALGHVMDWLRENIPYYWSRVKETFGPYVSCVVNWVYECSVWLYEVTAAPRAQVAEWTKSALIVADDWFRRALVRAGEGYENIRPYLIVFWTWMVEKLSVIYSFFKGEVHWCCVRDALVGYASYAYEQVLHATQVLSDYVSGENMK